MLYKLDPVPMNEVQKATNLNRSLVVESASVIGGIMKSIEADLLDRLEGWNDDSIRLLTVMLERIAELPDAEATALTERILAQIDGQMH